MTFEQFMASILNENALVRAFETKIDVVQKLLDHERPAGTVGSFSTSSNAGTEYVTSKTTFYNEQSRKNKKNPYFLKFLKLLKISCKQ